MLGLNCLTLINLEAFLSATLPLLVAVSYATY